MKEESVLSVLMYLFKHHMHENVTVDNNHTTLVQQLVDIGFRRPLVYSAFEWLEGLNRQYCELAESISSNTIRLYTAEECYQISRECRGFLITLEQRGILKPHTREMVISQVLALSDEAIDVELIRWVTLIVLSSEPDEKAAQKKMETLVQTTE